MGQDYDDVGFDEGMSFLPSHVADEALRDIKKDHEKQKTSHRYRQKLPAEPAEPLQLKPKFNSRRPNHRPKHSNNWASGGGHGMQAFFLDSGRRSCGTGVFLPQRAGTNNSQQNKRPACAPVFLPSRVVQALNLNVQALGLQISPRTDGNNKKNSKDGECCNSMKNKNGLEASPSCCVMISPAQSSSQEIFLPEEWTY